MHSLTRARPKNCVKCLPPFVFVAERFDVFAAPAGGAGNATNALQSPLNLHHRINTILTSATGAKSFGAEDKPGDQVARNNLIGARAGTLERPGVNELRDRSVDDGAVGLDAAMVALSGRVRVREGGLRTSEEIIAELWRQVFGLSSAEEGDGSGKDGAPIGATNSR